MLSGGHRVKVESAEEKVNYLKFKQAHRKFGYKTVNCVVDAIFILL